MPEGDRGISEEVDRILEECEGNLPMVDALYQWGANPTSKSAGFGVEQNYPYISDNLKKRYPDASHEQIIEDLKEFSDRMLELDSDVYNWRNEIKKKVKEKFGKNFIDEIINRIKEENAEKWSSL